jgi:hypothetical protein
VTWCTWLRFETQQCHCGRSYNTWFSSKKGWWVVVINLKKKSCVGELWQRGIQATALLLQIPHVHFSYVGFINNNCFRVRSFSKFRSKESLKVPLLAPQTFPHLLIPHILHFTSTILHGFTRPQTFYMGNVSAKEEMEKKPKLHIHAQHWLKPSLSFWGGVESNDEYLKNRTVGMS